VKDVTEKNHKKSTELISELDGELADLRVIFLEIIRNYQSKIEQDIQTIREFLLQTKNKTNRQDCKLSNLKKMFSILEKLQTKPELGRRKDFKKVEDAISEMLELIKADK